MDLVCPPRQQERIHLSPITPQRTAELTAAVLVELVELVEIVELAAVLVVLLVLLLLVLLVVVMPVVELMEFNASVDDVTTSPCAAAPCVGVVILL